MAIDSEGAPLDRVVHLWPLIIATIGAFLAMWKTLVTKPMERLDAVESRGEVIEGKVDQLAEGIDEIRIAQARASDQHKEQLSALAARIDRALEIIAGHHDGRFTDGHHAADHRST